MVADAEPPLECVSEQVPVDPAPEVQPDTFPVAETSEGTLPIKLVVSLSKDAQEVADVTAVPLLEFTCLRA